jgi:hypothetical protein
MSDEEDFADQYKKLRFKMRNHTTVATLPILWPGKRQAGHLRVSYLYVFWLLLFVMSFGAPLLAQQSVHVEDGLICQYPGQEISLQNSNPDNGTVISISCVCIKDSDGNSATWYCKER